MKVLLIGNYLLDNQYSMQRFSRLMAIGLSQKGINVSLIHPIAFFGTLSSVNFLKKWLGYVDKYILFPLYLLFFLPSCDIVHICDHSNAVYGYFLRSKKWIVTCHDLLAVRFAMGEFQFASSGITGQLLQKAILHSLSNAPAVVCVSTATRNDLFRIADATQIDSFVIYNCLASSFRSCSEPTSFIPEPSSIVPGLKDNFFLLHVGANTWYKNRAFVVKVFSVVRDFVGSMSLKLVMVGSPDHKLLEVVDRNGLAGDVLFVSSLSDLELFALYSSASVFIFPSLAEGFGWPVLEALSAGCPIACSRIPSLQEISLDIAKYFDPIDSVGASKSVISLLEEPFSLKAKRAKAGISRATEFSLDSMITSYLSVYTILF